MNDKLCTLQTLAPIRQTYRQQGRRVIWTNGCFDVFHAGHVASLQAAKALGDVLIVGLNSDRSVRELKGPRRPVVPQEQRAAVLCALSCVDHVILFDGKRCTPELAALHPDVYAQGAQYTMETIDQTERAAVEAGGGSVAFLPMQDGISTSNLVERIVRTAPGRIISAACAMIRNDRNELLFVANTHHQRRWSLPGGGQEFGERLEETVVREVREETGLEVEPVRYRGVIERIEPSWPLHLVLHMYECRITGGELVPHSPADDVEAVEWFSLKRLLSHSEHVLGRQQYASYLRDPEAFPTYTLMGPGEE